jgi:hypothetical protein
MKNKQISLHELESQGREKKSQKEKITHKRQERVLEAEAQESSRKKKLAVLSTSPLINALRINFFLKIVIPTLWLLSLAMAYPYLIYFIGGEPVSGYSYRSGTHWRLDPQVEGYALFWPFVILTVMLITYGILWVIARAKAADYFAKEIKWMETLPFSTTGYPDVLQSDSDDRFRIKIYYKNRRPENSFMDNVIKGLNTKIEYEHLEDIDELEIDFTSDWTASSKSGFKFHKLLHQLCDNVFLSIHQKYPIEKIAINLR